MWWGSHLSAEIQSVYSTAQANTVAKEENRWFRQEKLKANILCQNLNLGRRLPLHKQRIHTVFVKTRYMKSIFELILNI